MLYKTVLTAFSLQVALCLAARPFVPETSPDIQTRPESYFIEASPLVEETATNLASEYEGDAPEPVIEDHGASDLDGVQAEQAIEHNPDHVYGCYYLETGEHHLADHRAEGRGLLNIGDHAPEQYRQDMATLRRRYENNEYPEGRDYRRDLTDFRVWYRIHRHMAQPDDHWGGCIHIPEYRMVLYHKDIPPLEVEERLRNMQMPLLTYDQDKRPHCNVYTE